MTKEEKKEARLKRARGKVETLRKKTKSTRRVDRMKWQPKAKIVLHPDSDILDRRRIWFPKVVEDNDEKKSSRSNKRRRDKVVSYPFNVSEDAAKDPFAKLRKILRDNNDIPDDVDEDDNPVVILSIGKGSSKVEMVKGEILGLDGFNYKKRLIPRQEVVVAAVMIADKKNKEPDDLRCEVLSGPKSLGNDIRAEIEDEVDENGEEKGNPFFNPYPFTIIYDDEAKGTDMYSAKARPNEKIADDVMEILDADPPNISSEVELSDPDEMHAALAGALVYDGIDPKDFEVEGMEFTAGRAQREAKDDDDDDDDDDEGKNRTSRRRKKDEDDDDEAPVDDDDSDEGEASEDTEDSEGSESGKSEEDETAEEDSDSGDSDDGDEDPEDEVGARRRRKANESDKKGDGKKSGKESAAERRKRLQAELDAIPDEDGESDDGEEGSESDEDEDPDPKPEKSSDKKSDKKGGGKKEDGKNKGKKTTKKVKKKDDKKDNKTEPELGWEPGKDEDYDICPSCRLPIPKTATECPHPKCDAVYDPEDGDDF